MRVALLTFVCVLAFTARADASCIDIIRWDGDVYVGYREPVKTSAALTERAIRPACNDAGQNDPDTQQAVRRVRGIDPLIAITTGPDQVYVNASTFPQLKAHPLHTALGYPDTPPRRSGKRCTLTGAASVRGGILGVGKRRVDVGVDTKISLRRNGTAYVGDGTKVRVTGRCRGVAIAATKIERA